MVKLGFLFYLLAFNLMALEKSRPAISRSNFWSNSISQNFDELNESDVRVNYTKKAKGANLRQSVESQDDRKMRSVSVFCASRSRGSNVGGL